MTWYYGKSLSDATQYGFYTVGTECTDPVEVSDADYRSLMAGCTCNKHIEPNNVGYPVLVNGGYVENVPSEVFYKNVENPLAGPTDECTIQKGQYEDIIDNTSQVDVWTTIYDGTSSDPDVNWGYPGTMALSTINRNFPKFKKIRLYTKAEATNTAWDFYNLDYVFEETPLRFVAEILGTYNKQYTTHRGNLYGGYYPPTQRDISYPTTSAGSYIEYKVRSVADTTVELFAFYIVGFTSGTTVRSNWAPIYKIEVVL